MRATPLDPGTRERLDALFVEGARPEAERLLLETCSADVVGTADSGELTRVRRAALRASRGDLLQLQQAIDLARTDWRDLVTGVGFGDDPHAHERWHPRLRPARGTAVLPYLASFAGAAAAGSVVLWLKETFSGSCDGGTCAVGLIAAAVYAVITAVTCAGLAGVTLLVTSRGPGRRAGWVAWGISTAITALVLYLVKVQIENL